MLLSTLEEFDIIRKLQFPHTLSHQNLSQKIALVTKMLSRSSAELLLVTPSGFSTDFILAGLSEKHIEYIALNAPNEYKKEIFDSMIKLSIIKEIFEIARSMDDDLGERVTQNQDRVRNIIQYIKDNRSAFEF